MTEQSNIPEDPIEFELYLGGRTLEIRVDYGSITLTRSEALKLLAELPGWINQMTD